MPTPKTKIFLFLLVILLTISIFPAAALAATEGEFLYTDNGDGTCTITGYTGSGGDLTLPETLGGKTVTIIGNTAFFNTLLTIVTIPDTVTTIQDEAFSTNNITSVTLGSHVETIGVSAFADSSSLTSVALPSSLTFLDVHAFDYTGMSEITLPESEEGYISTWENGLGTVFHGGDTVPVNDSYTRKSYDPIFEYTVSDAVHKLMTITKYNGLGGDVVIPGTLDGFTVTAIGDLAFDKMDVTSVTIPDSVTSIGQYTFATNGLTSVHFGSGLQTIGKWAFMANSLSSVTLPSSLTELSLEAFLNSGVTEITLPQPEAGYISTWENGSGTVFHGGDTVPVGDLYTRTSYQRIFEYTVEDEFLKLIMISAYNGLGGDVVIPSTIDGYTVYGIGYCAFADKGITSVTLPDCLMFLQTGVFVSNPGLSSFNLPGAYQGYANGWYEYKTGAIKHLCGDEVTDMDANFRAEYEFAVHPDGSAIINNCNAEYTDIHVPASFGSLPTGHIGDFAFYSNFFSGDLTIPDGVINIGLAAFGGNDLTSVTIPNSVKKIGTYAFFMNPEISAFNLPSAPVGHTSIWSEIDPGSDIMSTVDDTIIGEHRSNEPVTNFVNGFEWLRNDINQYTVTFEDYDGSVIKTVTQNYGTALTYPNDPVRDGYTFSGWSCDIPAIPVEDLTITATYTENPPADVQRGTICGTLIGSDGKPLAGQTVTLHSDPVTAVTNSKGRFTFSNVPLTDHTMILQKSDGTEIGRYALSFLQSTDTSYTVDNTDIDVKVTANTVMIDILININESSKVSIEKIMFSENPQTGDAATSPTWIVVLEIAIISIATLFTVFVLHKQYRKKLLHQMY